MKLKEICEKTGLSRKTLRLYEEKGLIAPQKELKNGREYREYSEIDLQNLQNIALLRKSWFTMDEIRQMQQEPDSIQEIFPRYLQWLRAQKQDLDTLLQTAEQIEFSVIENISQLTEQMAVTASALPLPKYDVIPHFLYLDEKEEQTMKKKETKNWQAPLEEGISDSRTYRQFVASTSKSPEDDLAVAFGQAQDAQAMLREDIHGLVQEVPIGDAPAIAAGKIITLLLALVSGFLSWFLHSQGGSGVPVTVLFVVFAFMAVAHLALRLFARSIRKEKQRMREAAKR